MSEENAFTDRVLTAPNGEGLASDNLAGLSERSIDWDIDIQLLRSPLILKQLALALGIPILLISVFLLVLEWPLDLNEMAAVGRIALLLVGIMLFLLLVALVLVYGGRYEYRYRLDSEGLSGHTRGGTAKKNLLINVMLMLSGRPSAAGAGLLAHTRQAEYAAWDEVHYVTSDAHLRTITLRDEARHRLMEVFCDRAHYGEVLRLSQEAAARRQASRE